MRRGENGSGTETRAAEQVYRFGVFELSPDNAELRKNGVKVRLSGQPFQILIALVQKPGEVVTREQLRQQLWPKDTYVDFDHCLNTAVNKVREALGDAADNPRFIQTLPRVGYRFLAPVNQPVNVRMRADAAREPKPAPRQTSAGEPESLVRWTLLAAVVILLGAAGWAIWPGPPAGTGVLVEAPVVALPGMVTTPAFSPDGAEVAFAGNADAGADFDIYVQTLGEKSPRRLTDNPGNDFSPAFSPDGQQIAFYRRSGDYTGIFIVSPVSGPAARLVELDFGPRGPLVESAGSGERWAPETLSWSPDQKFLAMVDKNSPEAPASIFLCNSRTRETRQITFPPAGTRGDGNPAFSPDGQTIAFVRHSSATTADVYLAPLSGDPPRRLTSAGEQIYGLAWLQNGTHIIFSAAHAGVPVLWKISIDDATLARIAGISEDAFFPAVPRDGGRLVYVRRKREQRTRRVRLVAGAGAPEDDLFPLPGTSSGARYSPDGRRVVFTFRDGQKREIWVAGADGGQAAPVTAWGAYSASPRWSPDGRRIAFDSDEAGNWEIYVVDPDGGAPRRMTDHSAQDVRPSWSHDGKWLYFGSNRNGTEQIWKMPVSGGDAIQVTRKGGYDGVESPDGEFFYYTRRGTHGLWRVPVGGGEEELFLDELQWRYSRNWMVDRRGVYYMSCEEETAGASDCFVDFRDFATGATKRLAPVVKAQNSGVSVSPDGQWLLYTTVDDSKTEIMLVSNYR